MLIRFLGTHNAESKNSKMVSFLVDEVLAVEAGSLASELTFEEQKNVKAILLSHAHYDHIKEIPAFAFNNADCSTVIARQSGNLDHFVKVFGTPSTLQVLTSHLIDGVIYPEFAECSTYLGKAALNLQPLEPYKPSDIEGYRVIAIPVKHPIETVGFSITSGTGNIFYTGDTGPGLAHLWEHISPQLLLIDCTFPNRLESIARASGHLCPAMLKKELSEFQRIKEYSPKIVLIHLSPEFESEISAEANQIAKELNWSISIASEGDTLNV